MTCKVVLVCSPVSHLVGEIAPDDAILQEWQLEDGNVVVEVLDGLVGDDHAEDEEQQQGETCYAGQNQFCMKMAYANTAIDASRLRCGIRWSKNIRVRMLAARSRLFRDAW